MKISDKVIGIFNKNPINKIANIVDIKSMKDHIN